MLADIDHLVAYAESLTTDLAGLSSEFRLGDGGLSTQAIDALRDDFHLPPVYLRCLRELSLFGVSLGYFSLWPTADRKGDFVTSFRSGNEGNPMGDNRLIVGMYEANPICVGVRGDVEDTVFFVDDMSSPDRRVTSIAPDFEAFVLLAGNLHEISFLHEDSSDEAISQMEACCRKFRCNAAQGEFWREMAEVMVG